MNKEEMIKEYKEALKVFLETNEVYDLHLDPDEGEEINKDEIYGQTNN